MAEYSINVTNTDYKDDKTIDVFVGDTLNINSTAKRTNIIYSYGILGTDMYDDWTFPDVYYNGIKLNRPQFEEHGISYSLFIPYRIFDINCTFKKSGVYTFNEVRGLFDIDYSLRSLTNGGVITANVLSTSNIHIKASAGWQDGKAYVKTSDGWKESSDVYMKTSSGWQKGS